MAKPHKVKGETRPPIERMAIAWQMIRAGKLPDCTSLASRLEVSVKTVWQDLEFLRDRLGAQFEYDSRKGGYVATSPAQHDCIFCGAGRGRISNSPNGC